MARKNWKKHLNWIIPVGILLLIVFWVVGSYNGLVKADVTVDNSWADVESSYQRRIDLIPNLVATVEGAVDFEKETQTKIAEVRTGAVAAKASWNTATTQEGKLAAANQMEGVLGSFRALNINVERYPELKATQNFLALQDELAGTENRINVARNRYNEKVGSYNKMIRVFPKSMIASMFGFDKRNFFEAEEGAEEAPTVDFT
ncbi:MAG: LemA family protein [Nanoarchaeota archaeon]|nr:LemA family protein [Nanoarchaeota archaeon]